MDELAFLELRKKNQAWTPQVLRKRNGALAVYVSVARLSNRYRSLGLGPHKSVATTECPTPSRMCFRPRVTNSVVSHYTLASWTYLDCITAGSSSPEETASVLTAIFQVSRRKHAERLPIGISGGRTYPRIQL